MRLIAGFVAVLLLSGCAEMAYRDAFDHPGGPGYIASWESKLRDGESGVRMEPAITEGLSSDLWIGATWSTTWGQDAWLIADVLGPVVFDLEAPMVVQVGSDVIRLDPVVAFDGGDFAVRTTERVMGPVEYRKSTRKAFRIPLVQLRKLNAAKDVVFRVRTTTGFIESYSEPQDDWRSAMEAYPKVWFAGAFPAFLQAVK